MLKRLNDTAALRAIPLRGGDTASPNAGEARSCRGLLPGTPAVCFDLRTGATEVRFTPEPSVGSECLRSAVRCCDGGGDRR
jgi:hypothetical protein